MNWSRLDLGVGLIVTAGLDMIWEQVHDLVDVIEVEPQTMWRPRDDGGWDLVEPAFAWVEGLGVPALVHGVGFPVGGCEPPDPRGVALTAACAARLRAAHWSEHLSFNRAVVAGRGIDTGFLLPPAQTAAGVAAAAGHVAAYRAAAPLPFLVETGVNYLRPRPGELSDGAYIAGVAEQGDCGILLDLHNLWANQRNGRQPVAEVLDELPLDRVLEVHLAGGFEAGGYYLDAHAGPPAGELLDLAASVMPRLPNVRAVIFEAVPEAVITLGAGGLRDVLTTLHRLCDNTAGRSPRPAAPRQAGPRPAAAADLVAARDWERRLAAYTTRASDDMPADDPGLGLLRQLTDNARLGELTLARPGLLKQLLTGRGSAATERLLYRYLSACPPRRWTAAEGAQFAAWLAQPAADDDLTACG
jgi:uncharacterized protein